MWGYEGEKGNYGSEVGRKGHLCLRSPTFMGLRIAKTAEYVSDWSAQSNVGFQRGWVFLLRERG